MGKSYSTEGIGKLCIIDNIINKGYIFAYMIECDSLWHGRSTHIGISTMKRLIKSSLILCVVNNFKKCKISVKLK